MKIAKRERLCLVLIALTAAGSQRVQAQVAQAALQPDVKAFVTRYVSAFNAKDVARLQAMYHPKSLSCITPENKDYYDSAMAASLSDPIPAKYTTTVSPVNENNVKALDSMGVWFPVKPDQELQIDFQLGDDSSSMVIYLARENGHLYYDEPCATEQSIKQFREEAPARAKLAAEHKALADQIKEPLRSELIALIRQHETAKAIDRYKESSGQDTRTSMFVVHELATEAHE